MIDAVVLDLGGVVCRFDFSRAYRALARESGLPADEVAARLSHGDEAHAFETGALTEAEFLEHLNARLGSSIATDAFRSAWNDIFLGTTEGIQSLLPRIAARTRLLGLSNTNETHERHWRRRYAAELAHFERMFTSHAIGARKPNPDAYRAVLAHLMAPPERVVFFDDIEENVAGARAVGMRASIVTATTDIAEALAGLIGFEDG